MRKIIAIILVISLMGLFMVACGNSDDNGGNDGSDGTAPTQADPVPASETNSEPEPEDEPKPDPESELEPEPATNDANSSLVGLWNWMGMEYYTFNADGTGYMLGSGEIRWATTDGILEICATPDMCGIRCIAPASWDYSISGDELTLSSRDIPDFVFTYTRG